MASPTDPVGKTGAAVSTTKEADRVDHTAGFPNRSGTPVADGASSTLRAARHAGARATWAIAATIVVVDLCLLLVHVDRTAYVSERSTAVTFGVVLVVFALNDSFSTPIFATPGSPAHSMFEVPLVLGLFFLPPWALVLAHLVGSGLVLALVARQTFLKLGVNLATYTLADLVAVSIFRAVAGDSGGIDVRAVTGAFLGATVGSMLTGVVIAVVVGVASGNPDRRRSLMTIRQNVTSTFPSVMLGLIAVAVVAAYPRGWWLLLVPVVSFLRDTRARAREHRRRAGMDFVGESSLGLGGSARLTNELGNLLDRARAAFGAGYAEVVFVDAGSDPDELIDVIAVDDRIDTRSGTLSELGVAEVYSAVAASGRARVWRAGLVRQDGVRDFLRDRRLREIIGARVDAGAGRPGLLLLGNRRIDSGRFDAGDATLWEALAGNIGTALQRDELGQSLDRLTELQRDLAYRADHDALTGLVNRSVLMRELAADDPGVLPVALLLVDLDEFKPINDRLGHAAGDEMLTIVAGRLVAAAPDRSTVARLGGDEFALIIREGELEQVGAALVRAIERVATVAEEEVAVTASIGGVSFGADVEPAELLRRADLAMYDAKTGDGPAFVVWSDGHDGHDGHDGRQT